MTVTVQLLQHSFFQNYLDKDGNLSALEQALSLSVFHVHKHFENLKSKCGALPLPKKSNMIINSYSF